ncbi:EutN/CcmL family microcompartment protein [Clostridium coskatii]|uniref:Carbon dioxide concentrating mechanism protein CcmL n=1 Tax=Clostridium coskatii TaxID=1705578 RepID=A0A166U9T1_9CLOT|nr:EutN/CcmL family microcompartment protein [Clostridium coskatii]OAA94719.1 Carbon dioxide concentrating mechanism protein CcmL [Clostridium coskatii]OBR93375.1 carbon dioxide concentrating mechanism protein CcmL [Clostridium coskatii]
MEIGKIVGNVWATKKDDDLNGLKFLIVKPIDCYSYYEGHTFIAVDSIGSGIGEIVLVVKGSSARVCLGKKYIPVDATIVGIVDNVEVEKGEKE